MTGSIYVRVPPRPPDINLHSPRPLSARPPARRGHVAMAPSCLRSARANVEKYQRCDESASAPRAGAPTALAWAGKRRQWWSECSHRAQHQRLTPSKCRFCREPPLLARAAGRDSPGSARWQLRLFTPVAFCICRQPTSGDRFRRRRGAEGGWWTAATGQLNRAQKQDVIPGCLSGFTRRTSGRWSYLWGGQQMRECAEPRAWGGLPRVCVHRCHFSASERRQAEKLTPSSCVVIDESRCLYFADMAPTPSPPLLYYKALFPRHNTRESPSRAEPLSNSSEGFLIPTHGFCFRLDSSARQTPPLSGWLAIAGCCATVRVI